MRVLSLESIVVPLNIANALVITFSSMKNALPASQHALLAPMLRLVVPVILLCSEL